MRRIWFSWLVASCLVSEAMGQAGAAAATHPMSYSGCVSKVPNTDNSYALAAGGRCYLLRGTFKGSDLLDKDVVLRGVVAEATGRLPMTLKVESTTAVKESCSKTCTLQPPGSRGLNGDEKPGREGGTPGATEPDKP